MQAIANATGQQGLKFNCHRNFANYPGVTMTDAPRMGLMVVHGHAPFAVEALV